MMRELLLPSLYVFFGGGIGSVLRYLIAIYMYKNVSASYPFGTFAVNVIGSFTIGFIITHMSSGSPGFHYWRQLFVVGLIGGFTTFSAFSWDTLALFKHHETGAALLNIAANIILCLCAVWVGSLVGDKM